MPYTSLELEKMEQQIAEEVYELSKNASMNREQIDYLMGRLGKLREDISRAQAAEKFAEEQRRAPVVRELQSRQAGLADELKTLSREPTKNMGRITELDKALRELDGQIEKAQNE